LDQLLEELAELLKTLKPGLARGQALGLGTVWKKRKADIQAELWGEWGDWDEQEDPDAGGWSQAPDPSLGTPERDQAARPPTLSVHGSAPRPPPGLGVLEVGLTPHNFHLQRAGALGDAGAPAVPIPRMEDPTRNPDVTGRALLQMSQTMQAMHSSQYENDTTTKEGNIGYLKSTGRFVALAARGFNTFKINACVGVIGRKLFDDMQTAGTLGKLHVRHAGFPCPLNNRLIYGVAACTWGHPPGEGDHQHRLVASDFFQANRDQFETAPHPQGTKLGDKRRWGTHSNPEYFMAEWYDSCRAQIQFFCVVYGEEHRPSRQQALDRLRQMHIDEAELYPMRWIEQTWEALCWHWVEEIKLALRELYRRKIQRRSSSNS
jgi:hypothetical protein